MATDNLLRCLIAPAVVLYLMAFDGAAGGDMAASASTTGNASLDVGVGTTCSFSAAGVLSSPALGVSAYVLGAGAGAAESVLQKWQLRHEQAAQCAADWYDLHHRSQDSCERSSFFVGVHGICRVHVSQVAHSW